jgi:hypothetical protein
MAAAENKAAIDPACDSPWYPLHTGNYWVHRVNTRFVTGSFRTTRVLGPYELDGRVYCQILSGNVPMFLRVDNTAKIYARTLASTEQLLLDPSSRTAMLKALPVSGFAPTLTHTSEDGFTRTSTMYANGIGPIEYETVLRTGSSGGFTDGGTLVEARIDGRLYREPRIQPTLQLELNPQDSNCAVPCYFAACGIGSPVDSEPKPCRHARLAAQLAPSNSRIELILLTENGARLFTTEFALADPEEIRYASVPLYRQSAVGLPITNFAPGIYLLEATLFSPEGLPLARTSQSLRFPATPAAQ